MAQIITGGNLARHPARLHTRLYSIHTTSLQVFKCDRMCMRATYIFSGRCLINWFSESTHGPHVIRT